MDEPILLLLDNHVSHCSLEAIVMLSFPPHTSHRLQPLDVNVFGPFKQHYKTAFNNFLVNNPDRTRGVTIYDVPSLSSHSFLRAFSPENIIKGFSATGTLPFNPDIFPDSEFCESEEDGQHEDTSEPATSSSIVVLSNELIVPPSVPSNPTQSIERYRTSLANRFGSKTTKSCTNTRDI